MERRVTAPALLVVKPGMLTTVQDLGRVGFQKLGVPVAGPMDWYSHRMANEIVGNHPMAAALEVTLLGPELVADGDLICAVAGADIDMTVDGRVVLQRQRFEIESGARIRSGARHSGARVAIAVRGGFDVPAIFGSRATHLVSRMGPFGGRALKAGDRLPVGNMTGDPSALSSLKPLTMPSGGAPVRVVPGVHRDRFTDSAWRTLTSSRFIVTPQSNRMGYRLEGPPLEHVRGADILSEATPIGALQVPASGQPILLMADRQTTGGYTTIANVITADLPIAGQLAPGDWIAFVPCTHADALEALGVRLGTAAWPKPASRDV
jgi:antagonist of KipI